MKEVDITVPSGFEGRLDQLLPELLQMQIKEEISRSQLKRRIQNGLVLLNGTPVSKGGIHITEGDECTILEWQENPNALLEPYDISVPILFQDDSIAVVEKPPHLTVHPGAGTGNETLMNCLIGMETIKPANFPGNPRPGIVHRLDRDTSGLLVVARTLQAHAYLSTQFQERTLVKRYRALVLRKMRGGQQLDDAEYGTVTAPIGRDPINRVKMCIRQDGRSARTDWTIEERLSDAYLVLLTIHSGRTHQIRVHLESMGSGVLGDQLYGCFDTLSPRSRSIVSQLGRQALHACELHFKHPASHEKISFFSEIPHDMATALSDFRQIS
jgi:23S rRNA pseudouridine1911/1915/1917 synthase